jgi:ERCC4-related helicase
MKFVYHPLIRPEKIEMRLYQEAILNTATKRNTLVVLPTGLGKTTLAVLLTASRLEKYPDSKILIVAPTRPLCAQHQKSFRNNLNIPEEEIILLTGKVSPKKRKEAYEQSTIICATPQTIRNDIETDKLDFSNFSLLIVDECHRSVKRYAYPIVAKAFVQKSEYPRILGLTASPGGSEEKIKMICRNLFIDAVEIRTEIDKDVAPYVKGLFTEFVKVDLPDDLKKAQEILKRSLKDKLEKMKKYNLFIRTKTELLEAQKRISRQLATGRKPYLFYLISLIVSAVKIWHVLELLETQSVKATKIYLDKIKQKKTKSDKTLLNEKDFLEAMKIIENAGTHPKIIKLQEIVKREIEYNEKVKLIIFSHFRDNIHHIYELLQDVCRPIILIGQAGERGLTQKEQINVIREYNDDVFNCLITSPIGEEGLHIPSADIAIFYDSVPSEIRTIQRRGRVGRTKVGKIIFLITKKTRDETYYWTAFRKERKMKEILRKMQYETSKKQHSVDDFF